MTLRANDLPPRIDLHRIKQLLNTGAPADRERASRLLGIKLEAEDVAALAAPVAFRRDLATHRLTTVAAALVAPSRIAMGSVRLRRTQTLCILAVRTDQHVVVAETPLHGEQSVGDVWPSLVPWKDEMCENTLRALRWAECVEAARHLRVRADGPLTMALAPDDTLFEAVLRSPDDDEARWVVADALMERGDPHGELIRAQLRLHHADRTDPEYAELRKVARALERTHATMVAADVHRVAEEYEFRRGFVSMVGMSAERFARHGASLMRRHPIATLKLLPSTSESLAALAECASLSRLRCLVIEQPTMDQAEIDLSPLASCGHLGGMRELHLVDVRSHTARRVFGHISMPSLQRLDLAHGVAEQGLLGWLDRPVAPKLTHLALRELTLDMVQGLGEHAHLDEMMSLMLDGTDEAALLELIPSKNFQRLTAFEAKIDRDEVARALLGAFPESLRTLRISVDRAVSPALAVALATVHRLDKLCLYNFGSKPWMEEVIDRLLACPESVQPRALLVRGTIAADDVQRVQRRWGSFTTW